MAIAFGVVAIVVIIAMFTALWPILNDNLVQFQDEHQCESVAKLYYNETTEECYTETPHVNVADSGDGYYPVPFSGLLTPGGILGLLMVIGIFAGIVGYLWKGRK